jgi:hypothetical protein
MSFGYVLREIQVFKVSALILKFFYFLMMTLCDHHQ